MVKSRNEKAFRRLMDEGFSQGNLAVVDEITSPAFVEHQPRGPEMAITGTEAVKAVIQSLRRSFPDIRYHIEDLAEQGDTIWARMKARATNTGPFFGHPPTGRGMEADVIDVIRFEEGKMVEHWGVPDRLGILMQLGLLDQGRAGAESEPGELGRVSNGNIV